MTISNSILAALGQEREWLDSAISALERIVRMAGGGGGRTRRRKRRMSAAGRKRIAAAQRARWAKIKAKKKSGGS